MGTHSMKVSILIFFLEELRLNIVSGDNQTERTGAELPEPLVVTVTDILGNPIKGIQVSFSSHDSASVISPEKTISGSDGTASCTFRLGMKAGGQHVTAKISTDSTTFTETAVEPACDEERVEKLCGWPTGHIIIATTSSSLLEGTGTVVMELDPDDPQQITKLYETSDTLTDITFSPRGELFLASRSRISKMLPGTYEVEDFCQLSWGENVKLDTNPGGIVAGTMRYGPFTLLCPPDCAKMLHTFTFIRWENVAVHPVSRDLYFLTGQGPSAYELWRVPWDGRTYPADAQKEALLVGGSEAYPKGMCFDPHGNLYIVFDGGDNFRRIFKIDSTGTVHSDFFDFYEHGGGNNIESGRWGDITYSDGKLFVIDTRNDRLVAISETGEWLEEIQNSAFSLPGQQNELYSITATPDWYCD